MYNSNSIFPNIFEEIFYKGEPENVGTVISLIWKDDLKFCKFLVTNYSSEQDEYEIHFKSLESFPKIPPQEMQIKVKKTEEMSTIEFKNIYICGIDSQQLSRLSNFKKNILDGLDLIIKKVKSKRHIDV